MMNCEQISDMMLIKRGGYIVVVLDLNSDTNYNYCQSLSKLILERRISTQKK